MVSEQSYRQNECRVHKVFTDKRGQLSHFLLEVGLDAPGITNPRSKVVIGIGRERLVAAQATRTNNRWLWRQGRE